MSLSLPVCVFTVLSFRGQALQYQVLNRVGSFVLWLQIFNLWCTPLISWVAYHIVRWVTKSASQSWPIGHKHKTVDMQTGCD